MNAQLQKTLDNLETALATLLDSLIAYNPSSQAARNLVAAEEVFTNGLAMVAEHQALYNKLQSLKELSDSLDNCTLELLKSLESTHAELLALPPPPPVSTSPTAAKIDTRVPYNDLLDYARKIAKFTQSAQLSKTTEEELSGGSGKVGTLTKDELDFLVQQGQGNKVWPFPSEDKMRAGALGWLAQGGQVKREAKGA